MVVPWKIPHLPPPPPRHPHLILIFLIIILLISSGLSSSSPEVSLFCLSLRIMMMLNDNMMMMMMMMMMILLLLIIIIIILIITGTEVLMRRHEQLQSAKIRNGQQQPHQQQQPAQLRHLRPSAHAPPTALPLTTFRVLSKSRLARDECRPDRPSIALRLRGEAALGPARPVSDRPVSARPGPVRPETEWDGPNRPAGVSLRVLPPSPRPPSSLLPSRSGGVRFAALVALETSGVRTRPWPLDGAGGGIFRRFCLAGDARRRRPGGERDTGRSCATFTVTQPAGSGSDSTWLSNFAAAAPGPAGVSVTSPQSLLVSLSHGGSGSGAQ